MEIDTERIDEAVLALLLLGLPGVEELRLGCDGAAAQEGLDLRSGGQGKVCRADRGGPARSGAFVRAEVQHTPMTAAQSLARAFFLASRARAALRR